jgi:hypothetical protein
VSNVQLCKEDETMAALYKNKSVAEQNSLDTWAVLMSEEFEKLRVTYLLLEPIFDSVRWLSISSLATDILTRSRMISQEPLGQGFLVTTKSIHNLRADCNDTPMQASDVSHMMQHWMFTESGIIDYSLRCAQFTKHGRMGADPATFWYKGELGF